MRTIQSLARVLRTPSARDCKALELTGLCLASSAFAPAAFGQAAQDTQPPVAPASGSPEQIVVTAQPGPPQKIPRDPLNTPQSVDVVSQEEIQQQSATTLQDALRYAPGITLNSGEGGAHGDNINLRGFHDIDAFFLDGIRDPGSYARDSFDLETLEVLQGPSSVLFGNGSPGGIVNQTSKQPSLATLREATVEGGTNAEARGTFDLDQPIGPHAAFRINLMGETTGVADRDYVQQNRWGVAPAIALGLGTPTVFTLKYFHQEENNLPDYGVPFLFGGPAPVDRSLYYGLKNYDITQTNVDIGTAAITHQVDDWLSISNTARYARYFSNYRVSAPIFGNDFTGGPPDPGTPLSDALIYRDRPSSEGTQTYLTDHTDATARFRTFGLDHTLLAGVEFGRQTSDFLRFDNGFEGVDGVAPTPLLAPDADEMAPDQHTVVARPDIASNMVGVYANDSIRIVPRVTLDVGIRYDRYDTKFHDSLVGSGFHSIDEAWSPKAALVFKPTDAQSFYFSYTTSFDPAVSYLTLASDAKGPSPSKAKTYEIGAKARWLGGLLTTTAAVFRIEATNIVISDPDDPTVQEVPGDDQRIQGAEFAVTGHLLPNVEINANYTYLDPEISSSVTPGEQGKAVPGAARNIANLWAVYEPSDVWQIGTGINYEDHRFADALNTASVPAYVIWNALVAYQVTPTIRLQANMQNITDAHYYTGAYYTDSNENHVLPGQGRVLSFKAAVDF